MYKQMLDALAKCEGIEDYRILHVIDRDNAFPHSLTLHNQVVANHPLGPQITTYPTDVNLGCCGNTYRAWKLGFDTGADFVIYLEDDTIPSLDYLKYMEFCNEKFKDDPEIFCVVGYNKRLEADYQKEIGWIGKRKSPVTYQAWGTWRRIWNELENEWFGIHWADEYKHPDDSRLAPEGEEFLKVTKQFHGGNFGGGSWGYPLLKYFPKGRLEVFPYISRCQNIGNMMGAFNPNPQWHRIWIHTPVFADQMQTNQFEIIP